MNDRLDEILHRLRDLDDRLRRLEGRRVDEHEHEHEHEHRYGHRHEHRHGHRHAHEHAHGCRHEHEHARGCEDDRSRHRRDRHDRRDDDGFDEKRVIDTIVRLVCENVAPIVGDVVARELERRPCRCAPDAASKVAKDA